MLLSSSWLVCFESKKKKRKEIEKYHHFFFVSVSIWLISFVKIENLIRWLNCSCSWIYPVRPCGTPIIIIMINYWWKWVNCVTERPSSGRAWVTNMSNDAVNEFFYARDLIRLGTRLCVSIETNCHCHHRPHQYTTVWHRFRTLHITGFFCSFRLKNETHENLIFFFLVCPTRSKSIFIYHLF